MEVKIPLLRDSHNSPCYGSVEIQVINNDRIRFILYNEDRAFEVDAAQLKKTLNFLVD